MTVADTTPKEQSTSITFEFDLRHRPEKVWRALTEPALLSKWLLAAQDVRLKTGERFTLQAPPQPGWDGNVNCRFTEIEPLRKLSYSWVVGEIDTVVTFTLEPTETGTRMSLLQTGFREEQKKNFGGARYGWRHFGTSLETLLDDLTD